MNTLKNKNLLPLIPKQISNFLYEEEGNMDRGNILLLGSIIAIIGLLYGPENLYASHYSHRSHSSHSSHRSHYSHYSHSSGSYYPPDTTPDPTPDPSPSPITPDPVVQQPTEPVTPDTQIPQIPLDTPVPQN